MAALAWALAPCAALAGAATASAHAELVDSSPLDGEMVIDLPAIVELTFSETIGKPADLVVLDPSGNPLASTDVVTLDTVMWVELERVADPVAGWYTVSYQVTSEDGHLITGSTTFMLHTDGTTDMTADATGSAGGVGTPGGGTSSNTDADPWVVGALVLGMAAALVFALAAIRRLLADAPPAGAGGGVG